MGLIREPKNVDFYVDDRPLTEEEKRLLKAAIAKNKAASKTKRVRVSRNKVRAKSRPRPRTKVVR